MICWINFKRARYEGPFTPPELGRRNIEYPGYNGGSDWGSVAVDPQRGVIIANYNDMPNYDMLVTRKEAEWLLRQNPLPPFISGRCGQTDVALLDVDFVSTRASCTGLCA